MESHPTRSVFQKKRRKRESKLALLEENFVHVTEPKIDSLGFIVGLEQDQPDLVQDVVCLENAA